MKYDICRYTVYKFEKVILSHNIFKGLAKAKAKFLNTFSLSQLSHGRALTNLPDRYILLGMTIYIFKCLRCGHEWPSKQERPLICPRCKSPYWDRPRKVKK